MTPKEFMTCVETLDKHCLTTLQFKEQDYSSTINRLIQFEKAAFLRNTTLLDACGGMAVKHFTKLFDLIDRQASNEGITEDQWLETIGDAINYLRFIYAIQTLDCFKIINKPTQTSEEQIRTAPVNTIYVCSEDYANGLCLQDKIPRKDLLMVFPKWVKPNNLMTTEYIIVVDHKAQAELTPEQIKMINTHNLKHGDKI